MIEVHVVSSENSYFYQGELDQYFRCRHDIFVEERGWSDISKPDGVERDQYDDENAIYLLALDDGSVVGGQRFYPTTLPHMLSEVFAHLSQWPIPQCANTWEATRYCVLRGRRVGRADAKLLVAMQQFCLEEGIAHLTGVIEVSALPRWLEAGFKLRPLGLPHQVGGVATLAVIADVTTEGFATMLARLGSRPTTLVRRGLDTVGTISRRAA